MKRYFDMPEERVVLEMDITVGTGAAHASCEQISKHFGLQGTLREVDRPEYQRLIRQYMEGAMH